MRQNRSSAVMQQRREPHHSLDDFPTPPWATRALCEWLIAQGHVLSDKNAREPAANRGFMARPMTEHFASVEASDVHDYGAGYPVVDYLWGPDPSPVDWTFCNPPFRLAQQFIERALRTSTIGVAMIVRSAFTEGASRYSELFAPHPPAFVVQHVERVPMVRGRYDPSAASATAYSWIVWVAGQSDTRFRWLPPCRKRLERPSDYEVAA
ncbi:methyltransferase [Blastomonas sp. CCH5-E3]|uniref:methyltransferase n=2 Tax=Alphaproteobacteria TaxID=28211 RepID=UPI0008253759|nr:methyltransferase [Blastomonas sp. CCH5-E3]